MRSLSNFKSNSRKPKEPKLVLRVQKGQFLIITALVMVTVFYLVSRWMDPFTIPDTAEIVLQEEPFIFNNIKEESLQLVNKSKSCEELIDNLNEYETYLEDYAFKKLIIYFDYTLETPCLEDVPDFPILVLFNIRMQSQNTKLGSKFYGFWPSYTAPE